MTDFDVIFLGGLIPKEIETDINKNSKGSIQNAANNLQWEIVRGLDQNLISSPRILNSLYVGSFPKRYKKAYIPSFQFNHNNNEAKDINIGFINITGVKSLARYYSVKPYLKRWALDKSDKKKVVIAYAMTFTFTELLKYVKKIDDNIITCLVVPDLPQYMNLSSRKTLSYNVFKYIEIEKIKLNLPYVDSYVLLTKYMKDYLNIEKPYVILEGIAPEIKLHSEKTLIDDEKIILYTGGLQEKYGVLELVKSFGRIENKDYRLVICGSGELVKYIKTASANDSRIIFKGQINREEVLKLQKNATLLINPRTNDGDYTKYSFPSKILEYMVSGTPTASYMLDGIPQEYNEYIYTIDENQSLEVFLKEILSKSNKELIEKGKKAREFVLSNKSSYEQVRKIVSMLHEIK